DGSHGFLLITLVRTPRGGRYRLSRSPGRTQKSSRTGPTLAAVLTMRSPLRGVIGDKTAKVLDKGLDLQTCGDLLRHYPRRYVERAVLTPLTDLVADEYTTVMAEIVSAKTRPMRQRRGTLLEVVVTDGRGRLTLTCFNHSWP